MTEDLGQVHFIGIGGAGMSGIARILLARGVVVSGSNLHESATVEALRSLGASVHIGEDSSVLPNADTVVVSTAIPKTNSELVQAHRLGKRVLHRAEALAAVMAGHRGIAVSGTAGKTTTTSMLTIAVQACGLDPSFAIGGDLATTDSNAHHGTSDLFIAEADESDGSYLFLSPYGEVVTNIGTDHLDQHGTSQAYAESFEQFVARLDSGGFLVTSADDAGTRRLVERIGPSAFRVRTFGDEPDADLRTTEIRTGADGSSYCALLDGQEVGEVQITMAGRHMVRNSAAALLAGLELGLPAEKLIAGLASYQGTRRRFEFKGIAAGTRVYDDYAHHPSKIAAQLDAARLVAMHGRLVVVFQPHLYSRTKAFAIEFGEALALADEVVVMDVYGAREDPLPGVTGALVASQVPLSTEHVHYQPSWSAVASDVVSRVQPGDLVVTMGAGDVTLIGPEILRLLSERDLG